MGIVEPRAGVAPPTCPICGERGRGRLLDMGPFRKVGNYICPDGHIYIVSAYVDGVA